MKNVCSKHLNLKRPQIKNPTLSAAANQIRSILFVEAKQNLNEMMMFDSHVKFAKSIGVKDTKIRHASCNNWKNMTVISKTVKSSSTLLWT